MTDTIEIKQEGAITKPIDAFRQTPDEGTPTDTPESENKTPESGDSTPQETKPTEVTPENKPEDQATPPSQPAKPTEDAKPEIDYKKKFSESTRRNQIVESQFKELQKVLGDITKQEVPTDDEMARLIPEWEYLSDREKNSERKLLVLEHRQNNIMHTFSTIASESETMTKLEEFAKGETRLAGHEEEFYSYAMNPKNKGASMEVLLNAFLFETTPIVAIQTETPPVETPPSLERGNPSGGNTPESIRKGGEMSDDELKALRQNNPRQYNEMIRTGKIK
jgi:hypothetical protein